MMCFGVLIGRRPRGIVGSRAEPDRIGVSVCNQAISISSNERAGERGGALVGKPRWARILAITTGSSMAAMILRVPPQWGQCSRGAALLEQLRNNDLQSNTDSAATKEGEIC